jgi:hypothetical protein
MDSKRFAVVFKTHFWDAFVARQFSRLRERAGGGDLFLLADETHGKFPDIAEASVLRVTEETAAAEGYLPHPAGGVFWYNADYQLYHFADRFPEYDYIVTVEYDCVINIDVSIIVAAMRAQKLEFVGEPIRPAPEEWHWMPQVRPYYPGDLEFAGRLLCFAVFGRAFAVQLQAARRELTRRRLAAAPGDPEFDAWPNIEGFIGAEIARLGVPNARLSDFGDVSHYDWRPPYFEPLLPKLDDFAFVHPVLTGARFLQSITRHESNPTDLFLPGTRLRMMMDNCPLETVIPAFLTYFQEQRDFAPLDDLRAYALARGGDERLLNIARGKPATQSSTSKWSNAKTPGLDAANAVNGVCSGRYAFHTDEEDHPWWCVDLEWPVPVREIRVFNRMDVPERARFLIVSVSLDLFSWNVVYTHTLDSDFGGSDGRPLKILFAEAMPMRFVSIALARPGMLHLEQVEIYA